MQSYNPTFEIPDSVKKSFIAERDQLLAELTSDIPDADKDFLGNWLDSLDVSKYQSFVDWWKESSESAVVTENQDNMLSSFEAHLARIAIAANGLSNEISGIPPVDISAETDGLESFTAAINESASATGLTSESIQNLKDRYKELDSFDANALFENTATGVRLNTRELVSLEKQYENLNRQKITESLAELTKQYEDLTKQISECQSETAKEDFRAQRKAIEDEIDSVKRLAAEYNGLTSAYAEWINAQNTTQAGSWYDEAKNGLDSLKELYKSGDYGNTALQEGLEFFTGADITGIDDWRKRMEAIDSAYQQLNKDIEGTSYSINDFMAGGQEGCNAFLQATKQLNGEWAKFDSATNSWELDYNKFDLAAAMGTTPEFIEMMQDKLQQYGFQFNNAQAEQSADTLEGKILEIQQAVQSLGSESVDIPINLQTPEQQLDRVKELIDEIKKDNSLGVDEKTNQLQSLYDMVDQLVKEVNQPAYMSIDVSEVDEPLQEGLGLLQEFQNKQNEISAMKIKGADVSELETANSELVGIAEKIADLENVSDFGLNLENVETDDLVSTIESQLSEIEIPISATVDEDATVSEIVQELKSVQDLINAINSDGVSLKADASQLQNILVKLRNIQALIEKINDLTVDPEVNTAEVQALIEQLNNVQEAINNINAATIAPGADGSQLQGLLDQINTVQAAISQASNGFIGQVGTQSSTVSSAEPLESTVTYSAEFAPASPPPLNGIVTYSAVFAAASPPTLHGTVEYSASFSGTGGVGGVSGTAHASGTANASGTAKLQGDWGTAPGGKTLVGELGPEIVVIKCHLVRRRT